MAGKGTSGTAAFAVAFVALVALGACGARGPKPPSRDEVAPLLQAEANDLKANGEKLDPVLGVRATWTISGIDVAERPGDRDRPWAGTIRFHIRSETKDIEKGVVADEFDRSFDYVYSTALGKWIFQLPPSPAPAGPR